MGWLVVVSESIEFGFNPLPFNIQTANVAQCK